MEAEMGREFPRARIGNRGSSRLPSAAKNLVAIAVFGCLFAGTFAVATNTAGAARSERAETHSVDRTSKGDRLAPKPTATTSSRLIATMQRVPIGCDPAFSRAADPARAHIFGRCIS